eukprot:690793-Prymnesium_polylepis.1
MSTYHAHGACTRRGARARGDCAYGVCAQHQLRTARHSTPRRPTRAAGVRRPCREPRRMRDGRGDAVGAPRARQAPEAAARSLAAARGAGSAAARADALMGARARRGA